MLCGSCLVVLCLGINAEFPELLVKLMHEGGYSFLDGTEIMVVHLLTLWRSCSE